MEALLSDGDHFLNGNGNVYRDGKKGVQRNIYICVCINTIFYPKVVTQIGRNRKMSRKMSLFPIIQDDPQAHEAYICR